MHEMNVEGITIDTATKQAAVILSDHTRRRVIPIYIGLAEATAISRALQQAKGPRPMTHQLMLKMIDELGYRLDHMEINGVQDGAYLGTLCLLQKDASGTKLMDCRPSDGIALATTASVPIWVSPEIFDEDALMLEFPEEQAEDVEFKHFVGSVNASDFNVATAEGAPEPQSSETNAESGPDEGTTNTEDPSTSK